MVFLPIHVAASPHHTDSVGGLGTSAGSHHHHDGLHASDFPAVSEEGSGDHHSMQHSCVRPQPSRATLDSGLPTLDGTILAYWLFAGLDRPPQSVPRAPPLLFFLSLHASRAPPTGASHG
jgi:hypothetical protein